MSGRLAGRRLSAAVVAALLLSACGEEPAQKPSGGSSTATPPILQQTQSRPAPSPGKPTSQLPMGSGFDFYVLSLSWSPTWCAENDREGRTAQCNGTRDDGFIVHGLWPQNEQGFPEFCRSRDSDRVPDALGRSLFDIIPSMGLIGHEWRKHGTCSGLGQKDYFTLVRAARERIRIPATIENGDERRRMSPASIETALAGANPGLSPQAVAVTCDAGRLDEIRICLTKDLAFRACSEIDRGGCRARDMTIPSR